jgi:integral membrane protein (TIGR01906 family)
VNSHRVEVAVFAIAFTVFGLVALALVWSGDWAYAGLASVGGGPTPTILVPRFDDGLRVERPADLQLWLGWHRAWATYVIGLTNDPPIVFGTGPIFTSDEYAHMADVRGVFRGAEAGAVLALLVATYRVVRARGRGEALSLIRAGAVIAAAIVAVIGVVAVFAFDPLFLLFHEIFFPQGNFLFDPATSNLLRLYPEWYWQGITAGVGVSFIAVALVAAAAAHIALRRGSNTYTRAA